MAGPKFRITAEDEHDKEGCVTSSGKGVVIDEALPRKLAWRASKDDTEGFTPTPVCAQET